MITDKRIAQLVLGCWEEIDRDHYLPGNPNVATDDARIEAAIRKALEEDRLARPEEANIVEVTLSDGYVRSLAQATSQYVEVGYLLKNEYGFVSAHVPDLTALPLGQTAVYSRSPQTQRDAPHNAD